MVYIVGLVLIFLFKFCCSHMDPSISKNKNFSSAVYVFASFTMLFLISIFRDYGVGIDTQHYANKFLLIRKYSLGKILTSLYTERVEVGYALLNKLVGIFFTNPRAILVANSAVICYGMAHYVYRYAKTKHVAVILFICCGAFLHSLNITRQMMSCVMMINSWGELTHKRYRNSAIWFLVGISFHITSVVFAVVYFFYYFRENKKLVLIAFGASLILAMFYRPILALLAKFISAFSYLDNSSDKVSAGGIWLVWIIEVLIAGYFITSYAMGDKSKYLIDSKEHWFPTEEMICVPIFVVYYIVFTFLGTHFNYLDRFGVYFMLFLIPLFSNFGKVIGKKLPKYRMIYWIGLQLSFIGYFLLSTRATQYHYAFGW